MIAALVAKLIACGTPADVAATVIAEAFAAGAAATIPRNSADISAERRREKDRIRKQNAKSIPQNSAENDGIPQNSENASLSKKVNIEGKEEREQPKRNFRGTRLPDDWQQSAPDLAIAHELIGADRTRSELEKFRDHWKQQPGSKGVKLDWNAAWRNWIRRSSEFRGGTNNGRRTVHDAARDLSARVRALDEPAPAICDGSGGNPVRLLSSR